MNAPCQVVGCDFASHARGWCHTHYGQWYRGAPITLVPKRPTDLEYFDLHRIQGEPGECWIWAGAIDPRKGYGRFRDSNSAHRVSYALFVGPIPDGMTVDHLCFNPPCVNPEHLRLLTHSENSANSRRALSSVCKRGHDLTPGNYYIHSATGGRQCIKCTQLHSRAARSKEKARRLALPSDYVDPASVDRLVAGNPPSKTTALERQAAAVELAGLGITDTEIASRLRISERTVDRYKSRAAR